MEVVGGQKGRGSSGAEEGGEERFVPAPDRLSQFHLGIQGNSLRKRAGRFGGENKALTGVEPLSTNVAIVRVNGDCRREEPAARPGGVVEDGRGGGGRGDERVGELDDLRQRGLEDLRVRPEAVQCLVEVYEGGLGEGRGEELERKKEGRRSAREEAYLSPYLERREVGDVGRAVDDLPADGF